MSHADWIALLAPAVAGLAVTLAAGLGAVMTGLTAKAGAWLMVKGQASAATAIVSANTVIDRALMTGASTIAGKIQAGTLDYTDRSAIETEAVREVGLVQQRVPAMLAVAEPLAGALVASLMAKVDAQVVASPTIPAPRVVTTLVAAAI